MKNRLLIFGILLLLVGIIGLGVGGTLLVRNSFTSPSPVTTSSTPATGTASGFSHMPGGGMMGMNGEMQINGNATLTSPGTLQQHIQQLAPDLRVDAATNQIRYTTRQVSLIMVGAPPGHPGMYWQVDGRVNPTVVIPAGATVRVIFANGDSDTMHGWELTTSGPPYPVAPMMTVGVAAPNAFLMPVPAANGNQWHTETTTFSAPASGTYYYLCPVPGHAEEGMWGKLIVQ